MGIHFPLIMSLELKISDVEELSPVEQDGSTFDRYKFTAYDGNTEVGHLVFNRIREPGSSEHQKMDLLFDKGSPRSYVANLNIYGSQECREVGNDNVAKVGAKLLRAGNKYSKETFGTSLFGSDVLLAPKQQLTRDYLMQSTGISQHRSLNTHLYQVL
jgi:hypothetical protein